MTDAKWIALTLALVAASTETANAAPAVPEQTQTAISAAPVSADIPDASVPPCELHVWPGGDLRSTYYGWFHGGIVDGAVQGRDGYQKLPPKPLSSGQQLEILKSINLPGVLHLSQYHAVFHDAALDSRTLRTTATRLQMESPACYAELAIDDAFYQEDVFSGRYLKVIVRFRQFDGGAVPSRTFGSIVAQQLASFPPAKPEDDPAPWLAELRQKFGAVITQFGTELAAPPKRKKR